MDDQTHFDKEFRDKVIDLIKEHARISDEKVMSCIRIQWTQVGYDLRLNGYSLEYKEKPKARKLTPIK